MHKAACRKGGAKWYDKHRKCSDGNEHEGELELITWSCSKEETGWGHCFEGESDDLRRKFETEFNGDEETCYKYWPQGFRWTCCGTDADMKYGCDHHGTGSKPCTCDFCRFVSAWRCRLGHGYSMMLLWARMGRPLPDSVYHDESASRMGLRLRRGPDTRSFHSGLATMAGTMRATLGLDM
jgi:hypothetical protein